MSDLPVEQVASMLRRSAAEVEKLAERGHPKRQWREPWMGTPGHWLYDSESVENLIDWEQGRRIAERLTILKPLPSQDARRIFDAVMAQLRADWGCDSANIRQRAKQDETQRKLLDEMMKDVPRDIAELRNRRNSYKSQAENQRDPSAGAEIAVLQQRAEDELADAFDRWCKQLLLTFFGE